MEENKNKLNDLMPSRERYINPYTDFGFKKLFGTEVNKDLLISFLNALIGGSHTIVDLEYLNSEHLGDGYGDRRAIFDVYCMTDDGSRIIVEMQKAEQTHIKDRSLFYATFPIREQAPKGRQWDYELDNVYTIGVLNFNFPDNEYPADSYMHEIKLVDVKDQHVFYDKFTLLYLEIPKFNKTEDELETMLDKWMFVLRNLSNLLDRPAALQERVFTRLFELAEIAQYTPTERREYEASVKNYWDFYSTIDTAHSKGMAEGIAQGMAQGMEEANATNARKMKQLGLPIETIAEVTGLSADEIAML